MKISAIVTLKKDVLDPQGKVVQQALKGMGFDNVKEIVPTTSNIIAKDR